MRLSLLAAVSACALGSTAPALAGDMPQPPTGKEALEILTEAIEVPTVKDRGNVPQLASMLMGRLHLAGFAKEDLTFHVMGENGYLTARYPGSDASAKPIVLLVHMDVVEAKPEDWERDPFSAIIEDGYVFGRGSVDNKGDLSMIVATLMKLKREGWVPRRDIILLATGDEETAMATAAAAAQTLSNAEMVLNGDGGGGELGPDGKLLVYTLQSAEKTYADIRLTSTDPGGHSSRPDDSNPIATIAEALRKIANYDFPVQVSPTTKAYWEASAKHATPELAAAMRALAADPTNTDAAELLSAHPEYIGLVRTTCVPTMIEGGHAPNALPQSASANVNCRIFPGTSRAEATAILEKIVHDPAVQFELLEDGSIESPESPLRPDVMAALKTTVGERAPGATITPAMSAGASDSIFFRALGIPSYGVSATFIKPEDEMSHGLNERLPLSTIDPGVKQWETMLRLLAK